MARRKTVSIKDVAMACDVSATTVSLILNDRSDEYRIAPATRDKVLKSAADLGYKAVGAPKHRNPVMRSALWCIFAPVDFVTGPIGDLFTGLEGYARENDVAVETVLFPYRRGQLATKAPWISKEFCHGAIMVGLDDADADFIENETFDIPVVVFNRSAKRHTSVTIDNYAVGQRAMRHFQDRGHRRFGVVAPSVTSRSRSLRAVGFQDSVGGEAGGDSGTSMAIAHGELSYRGGAEATRELLAGPHAPTAIFVVNDTMVAGVMQTLSTLGLSVPDDVEVISFGDMPINTALRPTVTSIGGPTREMAADCARLLSDAGASATQKNPAIRMFDAEMIVRESSPSLTS